MNEWINKYKYLDEKHWNVINVKKKYILKQMTKIITEIKIKIYQNKNKKRQKHILKQNEN